MQNSGNLTPWYTRDDTKDVGRLSEEDKDDGHLHDDLREGPLKYLYNMSNIHHLQYSYMYEIIYLKSDLSQAITNYVWSCEPQNPLSILIYHKRLHIICHIMIIIAPPLYNPAFSHGTIFIIYCVLIIGILYMLATWHYDIPDMTQRMLAGRLMRMRM